MASDDRSAGSEHEGIRPFFKMLNVALSRCAHAVAVLGIADLLAKGPRPVDELAALTGAHPPSLYRVLRTLASEGIFTEVEHRHFAMTPVAERLRTDHPYSARSSLVDHPRRWAAWGEIVHSVRTGQSAFERVHGLGYFDWLASDPEAAAWFQANMESTPGMVEALVAAYEFGPVGTVVDVGGGSGQLLALVLQANPGLRGVLFEVGHVVDRAQGALERAGVADRCQVVEGSFFESVPLGGDAYLLSRVLHDWDDERAGQILRAIRPVIPVHGRLLVMEMVLPEGDVEHPGKWADITMLVMTGGQERTEKEFASLLGQSGFHLSRVIRTRSPIAIVEAVPA